MRGLQKNDRLFICATTADELYLLGLLQVTKVNVEKNPRLQEQYGSHRAVCRNLGGVFKRLPMAARKWQLRFLNTVSDRLNRNVKLAHQVRSHRFLSDESAQVLSKMLGEEIAAVERECRFLEGERRAAQIARSVRSPALRVAAKHHWGLHCYCCGFSFEEFYGALAKDFGIIHHLDPLGYSEGQARETSVEDVRVVCANCHYMLHRQDPPLRIDELRRRIGKSWAGWSHKGVSRRNRAET